MTPGGAHVLRSVLIGADMTEDELLLGITEALTIAGWRWTHIRRSDGVTQGASGLPDIIACHPNRDEVLLWELKSKTGRITLAFATPGIMVALAQVAGQPEVALQVGVHRMLFDPDEARAVAQAFIEAADQVEGVRAGSFSLDPSKWQPADVPPRPETSS